MAQKRILIVEVQAIIALDEAEIVRKMGYEVIGYAMTGEDAIRRAGRDRPDLVLMDIMLAGEIDGLEAGREIKNLYQIPVIFVTAHGDRNATRSPNYSPPENMGYIVKPYSSEDLQAEIKRLIG